MCLRNLKETCNIEYRVKKPYLFLKQEIIHAFKWYLFKPSGN